MDHTPSEPASRNLGQKRIRGQIKFGGKYHGWNINLDGMVQAGDRSSLVHAPCGMPINGNKTVWGYSWWRRRICWGKLSWQLSGRWDRRSHHRRCRWRGWWILPWLRDWRPSWQGRSTANGRDIPAGVRNQSNADLQQHR